MFRRRITRQQVWLFIHPLLLGIEHFRFKNWASKLAVNQGTLVYEATGKKIIPTEDTATVVMELHRMDGWHNSLKFTMDKVRVSSGAQILHGAELWFPCDLSLVSPAQKCASVLFHL